MAVSASMAAAPSAPAHGQTLVVSYSVTGADAVPPKSSTIAGGVVVDGVSMDVSTTVTVPGTPAPAVTYAVPTCPDLPAFTATADPNTFTVVVP